MAEFLLLLLSLAIPAVLLSIGGFWLVYRRGLLSIYGLSPRVSARLPLSALASKAPIVAFLLTPMTLGAQAAEQPGLSNSHWYSIRESYPRRHLLMLQNGKLIPKGQDWFIPSQTDITSDGQIVRITT